ncbi:MAG: sulfatase [Gemmataceae bacterium]
MHSLLPLLLAILPAQEPPRPERPSIVLINADDLGINDLRCYGRKDHFTPHLDRLASQGLRFTAAYCAQPICSPSRAGLLTGRAPARLRLTTYLPGRPDAPSQKLLQARMLTALPLEEKTLTETLREAGYVTGFVGKWHLGGAGFGPKEQGFDFAYPGRAASEPSATEGGKGEYELTTAAVRFIDANRDRPFFLYLAHNNPHIPIRARPELVKKHADAFNPGYAAMIDTLDDSVGRLLARLEELKLSPRTIVVFTSDNGGLHVPELRDNAPTHNTPFRAGKGFLYEGGLRVPLLVRWPGRITPGVSHLPVSHLDLRPTLTQLAGLPLPVGVDGITQADRWLGKAPPPAARSFYWHFPHYNNQGGRPGGAVREGPWKLITYYDTGTSELYNLPADPGEATDLAAREPKRVEEMLGRLRTWRQSVGAQENAPNPGFDEKLFKALYVDVDVSRLRPARTAAEMTPGLTPWRTLMDQVVLKRKP